MIDTVKVSGPTLLLLIACCVFAGCVEEKRRTKGWGSVTTKRDLHALQESRSSGSLDFERLLGPVDDALISEDTDDHPLRITRANGEVVLILRSPRHVIIHIVETLRNDERELLFDQIIAEQTKREYEQRGLDPHEAIDYLIKNRNEIEKLFLMMPAGARTPGVQIKSLGRNQFRLTPSNAGMLGQKYESLELTIEDGQFKLLMIR